MVFSSLQVVRCTNHLFERLRRSQVPETADRCRFRPGVTDGGGTFRRPGIACRGTGKLLVYEPALDRLQALRDALVKPLILRSAYCSLEHNRAVGGAKR